MRPFSVFLSIALILPLLFGCVKPFSLGTDPSGPTADVPDRAVSSAADTQNGDSGIAEPDDTTTSVRIDPDEENLVAIEEPGASIRNVQATIDEALDYCQVSQGFWQKGELENALDALDQAYALLLTVDIYDDPKLIQQKEDLRFMISKRILEIYASRNIVINGDHKAIPITLNQHVLAEIKRFTGVEKEFFTESYKRSGRYRPYIVEALKAAGMPVELSWLPLIESGFKDRALSTARALGLWQFIPSTGYKFGLKRDMYIDERLDPIKSTHAAIAYLKELHQIFGDWSTALASYNCGEGRVLRLIKGQNINYLDNFWDLFQQLPRETSRYFPRFLATLHMVNNAEEYGLDTLEIQEPLQYVTVDVARQVHLKDIAKNIGVTEEEMRILNPELRYKILTKEKYPLRLPPGNGDKLLAALDQIPISYPPQRAYVKHRVRPGESLSTIANRYRTSVSKIVRANNIRKRNFIAAGRVLRIPRKGTVIRPSTRYQKGKGGPPSTYTVRSGDSLWILARRYGTTTKKIIALNNLPNTTLHIRQVLKIPGGTPEPPIEGVFKTYKVKKGESPFRIARRNGMSLERFLRINSLTPRSKIYPGQNLLVE
ncbi:MAG: LysM peptidoglycan-binding domain-containing protein [Desulfobacterales bacterium]